MKENTAADVARRENLRASISETIARLVIRDGASVEDFVDLPKSRITLPDANSKGALAAIQGQERESALSRPGMFLVPVTNDRGNRWVDGDDPMAIWKKSNATVELLIGGAVGCLGITVRANGELLGKCMFEAVGLGTDESPDFYREVRSPQPSGANIPLETSPLFCLNEPLRVGLYVSDGSSVIGCMVFGLAGSLLDE